LVEEEEDARFDSFLILDAVVATIGKEKEDNKEGLKQSLVKQGETMEFASQDEEDASHEEEDAFWIHATEDELEEEAENQEVKIVYDNPLFELEAKIV
jgi:hypothetical protein